MCGNSAIMLIFSIVYVGQMNTDICPACI